MQSTNQSITKQMKAFLRIGLTLSLFLVGAFIAVFSKNPEQAPQ